MFYHSEREFKVYAAHRCGSTSMNHYFGYKKRMTSDHSLITDFSTKYRNAVRILVLRHPIQRYWSATNMPNKEYGSKDWYDHCRPYLHKLIDPYNIKIIKFESLGRYIPNADKTLHTNTQNYTIRKDFVENKFLTEQELKDEVFIYNELVVRNEEITPKEWRYLTRNYRSANT